MSSTTTPSKKAIRKAKVSSTAKRAAEVTTASDDAITVQVKSKKTLLREKVPKKSKTNPIEAKTIDALKNAATAVIFMNLFTIHCSQNGVEPTLKTIMDNVKNNDKIECETLKKLIHRNFRSKTLVPFKTDYEAANTKVVEAINHRNCSAQDVIKNIEAIMSYHNVINPVYLIHGTAEVQLEYLRSILDNNILALLKMVVPDWLQTDVAIKLNTQTDITECREAITELKKTSDSASNTDKIRAAILPEIRKGSKVDLKKIRSSFIVYRQSKGYCLNCGKSNHSTSTCRIDPVDAKANPGPSAKKQQ
ncbi:hypothetical protein ACTFIT_003246 [Dictyostelium discoideum]